MMPIQIRWRVPKPSVPRSWSCACRWAALSDRRAWRRRREAGSNVFAVRSAYARCVSRCEERVRSHRSTEPRQSRAHVASMRRVRSHARPRWKCPLPRVAAILMDHALSQLCETVRSASEGANAAAHSSRRHQRFLRQRIFGHRARSAQRRGDRLITSRRSWSSRPERARRSPNWSGW